uniref:Jacalin-type lectin domain-containing protein n=1 Tax=Leersia perrieri TaxID=77586 RepID=A0A0D9V0Q3_9ORYZ
MVLLILPPAICLHLKDAIIKIGMWGAMVGTLHEIVMPPTPTDLVSIKIKSIDTIDRLTFTYKDTTGTQTTMSWGGDLGDDHPEFKLNPNEYVNHVYGTVGPFATQGLCYTVNSITFVTNQGRKYGPWGTRGSSDAAFDLPLEKGRIVGFYVRADNFISGIGFYVRP